MTDQDEVSTMERKETEDLSDTVISDDNSSSKKYELSSELKGKIKDLPEVLDFIMLLQKYMEKQKKKLKKLRALLKRKSSTRSTSTQTDSAEASEISNKCEVESVEVKPEEPKTLAEEIKEAAELAVQHSGFVYEETSGLYYDYNTGYYYNAEYGLYYDGHTGTYMKYNSETQEYEFHSQLQVPQQEACQPKPKSTHKRKTKMPDTRKARKRSRDDNKDEDKDTADLEEGECSESSSEASDGLEDSDHGSSDNSEVSKQWPPCMRIIVEDTSLANIKKGSLYIITCDGGTLGREGHHSVLLSDVNVSKHHLKFSFDKEVGKYQVTDLGSRNGTLLNGNRMSVSKQESEPVEVVHGSKIQIGGTILLCHIHDGNQTCGHCEPGLIQNVSEASKESVKRMSKTTKSEIHKNELQNLRKKFGVASYKDATTKLATGYTDRAQNRRDTVGSLNPHEKTQVASLHESIPKENKGFKLLSKMGWKEGQALGKEGQGISEPVKLISNPGNAGIGSAAIVVENSAVDVNKKALWLKTQERFEKLPDKNDAFDNTDSDS